MASPSINDETIEKLIRQGIPGFDADWIRRTKAQMNQVNPLRRSRKHPALDKTYLDKLKYQVLVQIEKKESIKLKPWMSMEVWIVQLKQIENELLKEKLAEKVSDKFEITELGRRFIRDHKQAQESGK
jgi:predicted transcriptional regulator